MKRIMTNLGLTALLASCGGFPMKTFEIQVQDNQGNPIKCAVIVDNKWPTSLGETVFTDGEVKVEFRKREMNVRVFPVTLEDNAPVLPRSTDLTRFASDQRDLLLTDVTRHLFVLRRSPDF